jgi:phosphatidylserine/phosphatidylglycerophosphate/cardiolipin synthase-like enzyme
MPEEGVFASLHAKCIVVDGRWVFAMSANFTDRGQTRNVEMGVLLEDARLAAVLEAPFVAREWVTRVS